MEVYSGKGEIAWRRVWVDGKVGYGFTNPRATTAGEVMVWLSSARSVALLISRPNCRKHGRRDGLIVHHAVGLPPCAAITDVRNFHDQVAA